MGSQLLSEEQLRKLPYLRRVPIDVIVELPTRPPTLFSQNTGGRHRRGKGGRRLGVRVQNCLTGKSTLCSRHYVNIRVLDIMYSVRLLLQVSIGNGRCWT